MTDNDVVSLKCKLFSGNSSLFGSFPFVGHLCLGILKVCAHLALSFETISAIPTNSKTIPEHSELRPNAYLITSHRNALRSRILRAQRLRPEFVLRYCSIITIMLNNVATSNPRAAEWSSRAATKGDQQQQQEAQQHSYHSHSTATT